MAESVIVYAGVGKSGKAKKAALEREARRQGRGVSVADVIWGILERFGSPELRKDLEKAKEIRI